MTKSTNQQTQYLDVAKRTEFTRSSLNQLRKSGHIPASVYGGGTEAQSVYVEEKQLVKVARTGRTEFFDLRIDGGQGIPVLIKEFQQRSGKVLHVDFQKVSKNKPIRVRVPIIYNGTAKGTKVGGILQVQATELEIEGLPDVLPGGLEVDVTSLGTGDKLVAADIQLPEGITLIGGEDELLASIVLPRLAEADNDTEADPASEPESAEAAEDKE
ncbi:50S ribosomal protein L25 [Paenibacillus bouchesdurhonensis]|uniref:50S ribosomal protein L25 n=1 Tax=Paenibacillus bouchesdurhonensis TaxID=1870990 RepID=UPI000DA62B73|nr:50S ribosomal protein L25 [Paenibacillus bouchesdurhonensis]